MTLLERITDEFTNKFSDNLFTQKSTFPQDTTFNVTAGTGTSTFSNDAYYGYFANVLCTSYKTADFTFNFGDALTTPISKDGIYLFQLSIFDTDPTNEFFVPFVFNVNVFKNGVFDQTITGQMVSDASLNSKKTITFSQVIECNSVTELDFTFTIDADLTYPFNNMNFNIGNFKIEHDNKFLGLPTPYSLPVNYYIQSQGTGDNKVTGNIEMEVGVEPTEPQHLTTKAYVDSPENQTESQRSTATTGTESVNNNGINTIFIHDAVSLALTLTVNLPSTPVNNQIVTLNSVLGVTTLTLVTLVGSIVGGVTALAAGVSVRYIWMASQSKWYKI